jgi:hypothetical protein
MTIREYIRRRFRNLALIFALTYAALQILSVGIRRWPGAFSAKPWTLVLAFTEPRVLWIIVAWFCVRVFTIPYPRCNRPLGAAVAVIWGSRKINRCPHCRVSLDEPMERLANQP